MMIFRDFSIVCGALLAIGQRFAAADDNSLPLLWATHEVTFAISIGGNPVGNIVFGILFNSAPRTAFNFLTIARGNTTSLDGKFILTYKKSIFHRTIRNFMIQGGDISRGDGRGVASVYGGNFPDENFDIPHYGGGWIGMANAGPDTNGCQFYITCVLTKWLDKHHTIFGKVVKGMDVVRKIENNPTHSNERPKLEVVIEDCWVVEVQPYPVTRAAVEG